MLLAATGQAVSGFAPNFATLAVGIAVAGVFSVAAQVLIPFAASLAEPERSGQVVGTIMSGLLIGILLARSVAGVLSGLGGWSTVYKVAAVLMVVMAVALWRSLPSDSADRPKASYRATLASVGKLAATLPRLRTRSAMADWLLLLSAPSSRRWPFFCPANSATATLKSAWSDYSVWREL